MTRKTTLFMMTVGTALVSLLVITPAPASGQGEGQYKLGGAWTGKEEPAGHFWISTLTPLDSAARQAAMHTNFVTSSAEMAGIAAKFGADAFSDFVGEARMMDRTTARWTSVGYALKRSQVNQPAEVKFILVLFGTWTFTDPSHAVLQYMVSIYPAATDADGDGMPDAGAMPIGVANVTDSARRVPILQ